MKKKILVFLVFAGIILAGGLNVNLVEAKEPGCGTAGDRVYSAETQSFGSDVACATGYTQVLNEWSVGGFYFPAVGQVANWQCQKGNEAPVNCSASRSRYECSGTPPNGTTQIMCSGDDQNLEQARSWASLGVGTTAANCSSIKCQYYEPAVVSACGSFAKNYTTENAWPADVPNSFCNVSGWYNLVGSRPSFPTSTLPTSTWQCKYSYGLQQTETCSATKNATTYNCGTFPPNGGDAISWDNEEYENVPDNNTKWQYSPSDTSRKCEFKCPGGSWNGSTCEINTTTYNCGNFPTGINATSWGTDENVNVPANTSWHYSGTNDPNKKCEYKCQDGKTWNGTTCAVSTNPSAPTCDAYYSTTSINSGGSATLTWSATNDEDGKLEFSCSNFSKMVDGVINYSGKSVDRTGTVDSPGSGTAIWVSPVDTTEECTFTAKNGDKEVKCTTSPGLTVKKATTPANKPTVTLEEFFDEDDVIESGVRIKLRWTVGNKDSNTSCVPLGNDTVWTSITTLPFENSSNSQNLNPTNGGTEPKIYKYSVKCTNSVGSTTSSEVSITVNPAIRNKIPVASIISSNEPDGSDYTVTGVGKIDSPDKSEYFIEAGWYSGNPCENPNATMKSKWGCTSTGGYTDIEHCIRNTEINFNRLFGESCPDLYFMAIDNNGDRSNCIKSEKPEDYDDSGEDIPEDDPNDSLSCSTRNYTVNSGEEKTILIVTHGDVRKYEQRCTNFGTFDEYGVCNNKTCTYDGTDGRKTHEVPSNKVVNNLFITNKYINTSNLAQNRVCTFIMYDGNGNTAVCESKMKVNTASSDPAKACTPSEDPANATLCPGDKDELNANTAKSVVGLCSSPNDSTKKCEYTCNANFHKDGNNCVANATNLNLCSTAGSKDKSGADPNYSYAYGAGDYRVKNFCVYGEPDKVPSFPAMGEEKSWVCKDETGANSQTCYAKRNNNTFYSCTPRTNPANATICPKDADKNFLTKDTPKVLVDACSSPAGSDPKCEYTCNEGWYKDGDKCVKDNPSNPFSACIGEIAHSHDVVICPGDDDVNHDTQSRLVETCSSPTGSNPKCEYTCKAGYELKDGTCVKSGEEDEIEDANKCGPSPSPDAELCPGDDQNLGNDSYQAYLFPSCTSTRKCEYVCKSGYTFRESDNPSIIENRSCVANGSGSGGGGATSNDPQCGTASGKTYEATIGSFGSDTFCANGIASPSTPVFPAGGGITEWKCSQSGNWFADLVLLRNVAFCAAAKKSASVSSGCGDAVGDYSKSDTVFRSNNFCASGFKLSSSGNPVFPTTPGDSIDWVCRPNLLNTLFTDKDRVLCSATKLQ